MFNWYFLLSFFYLMWHVRALVILRFTDCGLYPWLLVGHIWYVEDYKKMSIYVLNTIFCFLFLYIFYHSFSNTNVILICHLDSSVIRSWFCRYYEHNLPSSQVTLPAAKIAHREYPFWGTTKDRRRCRRHKRHRRHNLPASVAVITSNPALRKELWNSAAIAVVVTIEKWRRRRQK